MALESAARTRSSVRSAKLNDDFPTGPTLRFFHVGALSEGRSPLLTTVNQQVTKTLSRGSHAEFAYIETLARLKTTGLRHQINFVLNAQLAESLFGSG